MKKILTVAVLFIAAASLQAQPLPYYQDAYNESGEDLREALYDIIKVHTRLSYSSSSTDTRASVLTVHKNTTMGKVGTANTFGRRVWVDLTRALVLERMFTTSSQPTVD